MGLFRKFVALALVMTAATACSKTKDEPVVAAPPSSSSTTTTAPTTTTTLPLTKEAVVLAPNGLGPVRFGDPAASAAARLTQALGPPDKETAVPVGAVCGATKSLEWADLQVFVNDNANAPTGKSGFLGWFDGVASTKPPLGLKTEKGIGIGSTGAQLKAAYGPDVSISRGEHGVGFNLTTQTGIVLGQLSGQTDGDHITNIQAGGFCGG
jgi:hypothetical protein